jgi:hypothetical protein
MQVPLFYDKKHILLPYGTLTITIMKFLLSIILILAVFRHRINVLLISSHLILIEICEVDIVSMLYMRNPGHKDI